jgi:hypothetical protein
MILGFASVYTGYILATGWNAKLPQFSISVNTSLAQNGDMPIPANKRGGGMDANGVPIDYGEMPLPDEAKTNPKRALANTDEEPKSRPRTRPPAMVNTTKSEQKVGESDTSRGKSAPIASIKPGGPYVSEPVKGMPTPEELAYGWSDAIPVDFTPPELEEGRAAVADFCKRPEGQLSATDKCNCEFYKACNSLSPDQPAYLDDPEIKKMAQKMGVKIYGDSTTKARGISALTLVPPRPDSGLTSPIDITKKYNIPVQVGTSGDSLIYCDMSGATRRIETAINQCNILNGNKNKTEMISALHVQMASWQANANKPKNVDEFLQDKWREESGAVYLRVVKNIKSQGLPGLCPERLFPSEVFGNLIYNQSQFKNEISNQRLVSSISAMFGIKDSSAANTEGTICPDCLKISGIINQLKMDQQKKLNLLVLNKLSAGPDSDVFGFLYDAANIMCEGQTIPLPKCTDLNLDIVDTKESGSGKRIVTTLAEGTTPALSLFSAFNQARFKTEAEVKAATKSVNFSADFISARNNPDLEANFRQTEGLFHDMVMTDILCTKKPTCFTGNEAVQNRVKKIYKGNIYSSTLPDGRPVYCFGANQKIHDHVRRGIENPINERDKISSISEINRIKANLLLQGSVRIGFMNHFGREGGPEGPFDLVNGTETISKFSGMVYLTSNKLCNMERGQIGLEKLSPKAELK